MSNYYTEVESDFYQYLTEEGGVNSHSRQNYMSWLKFLSLTYSLSADLSDFDIETILCAEETARLTREKYTKSKDLVNFKSALRKYRSFLLSDFRKKQEETVLAEVKKIKQDQEMTETERLSITRSRVGQGVFRERLITYWRGCSVTSFPRYDILLASHIRPWKNSDNKQRLDVYKGGGDFKIWNICEGKKKVCKFNYNHILCNRFWWKTEFAKCDWSQIERAFLTALNIGVKNLPKTNNE